ncbi:MAG: thiamine-phosphate kinase [Owenweeksia sp.]|nr:thiamine-phosphate kinase [Owenweeksia sp.]
MAENNQEDFTSIDELGEFGLIDHLTKNFPLRNASSIVGIGDDCAVLEYLDKHIVVTSDALVEGVHFDLTYVPPRHLGYKAVVANLSDVYAMNAIPKQIIVNLAVSNRFGVEYLSEIYEGIRLACEVYEVDLVGGDTTSSYSGLMLSITAIGEADEKDLVYRSGAKPTDLIVVSGDLGAAYMGLQLLEREKAVFKDNPDMQPQLAGYDYVLERQLKPEARKDIPETLKGLGIRPTAMMDISDGLSSEVIHICKASKVGARIYEENIPIDPMVYKLCEEFNLTTTTVALNGGEDYELLFTMDIKNHEKIKDNPNLTVIGHITEEGEGMNLYTRDDKLMALTAQGWDALLKKDSEW